MTENEWLTSHDLHALLRFAAGRTSLRKLRLFGCACCHGLAEREEDPLFAEALYLAELLADGATATVAVSAGRVTEIAERIRRLHVPRGGTLHPAGARGWFAVLGVLEGFTGLERLAVGWGAWEVAWHTRARWAGPLGAQEDDGAIRRQTDLLRDIVGNPFRPVSVLGEWLVYQDRLLPRLAGEVYDERRFSDLPILADALEDVGCDDTAILDHLRSRGPHARGCWVVDLLLGMW